VVRAAEQGEFDVIHTHLDLIGVLAAAATHVPVVATFHGRLDHPAYGPALRGSRAKLVGISSHQVSTRPDADWTVVHNGLTLDEAPFERRRDDALVFVGRITPEKGALVAVEAARLAGRPLRVIAKEPGLPAEREYLEEVFLPAIQDDDRVELLGELVGPDRDHVVASSHALLMPSAWPEPFGLVAIEALACGTPVIAHRSGGIPEIVREGVDGFFGDDAQHMANLVERVDDLDREAMRADAIERFSARRMTLAYEEVMLAAVAEAEARRSHAMDRPREAGRRPEVETEREATLAVGGRP
jgi:glycosyltransferase involved in cell wall biosynthesis